MKNKLKTILIILAIIVSCLSVGVYAGTVISATDVNYTKPNGSTLNVKAALDELYNKVPTREIGDEVTVGGEQFFVLEWNNDSDYTRLLSKYNLNSDATAQSGTAVYCMFSSQNYWPGDDGSWTALQLNNYIGFIETDALGKEFKYGRLKGAVSSGLLTYREARSIRVKANTNPKINNICSIGQNCWSSSTTKPRNNIEVINGSGSTGINSWPQNASIAGVRPVIIISKSLIS